MLELLLLLLFLSLTIIVYTVYMYFSGKKNVTNRLKQYLNPEKIKDKTEKEKGIPWREGLLLFSKTLGKSKLGSKYKEKIGIQLEQAHLPLKSEEYIAVKLLIFFAVLAVTVIFTENPAGASAIALIASCVPGIYMNSRRRSIVHKIDQQLPDTLALISNTLKSGYSFLQAVDTASKELLPPISLEFQRIIKEVNLGVNTEKALESLSRRVQSKDLELIIMAVLIQRQIGGNLSEILDNISETIRSRIKIKGEIKVLTAQGRISGMIIALLPVALGVTLYYINPEYISMLIKHPLGLGMLGAAAFMQGIGILLIRKIIKIEV